MANILLIGLGGMGCSTVYRTKQRFEERLGSSDSIACLSIDLDLVAFDFGMTPYTDFGVEDPARTIDELWKQQGTFRQWWPTVSRDGTPYRHVGVIGKGSAAQQIRPNGRLAGVRNIKELRSRIVSFLDNQGALDQQRAEGQRGQYTVYIITSLGGGTGSGILHEVVYACRENLQPEDTLYGIFYDGSVVKAWAPERTGIMSYTALVEIEHWFTRAADYYEVPLTDEVESEWTGIRTKGTDSVRYLDSAFIVQRINENGGMLTGRRTSSVRDDYLELTSGWLYTWLLGDMLQADPDAGKAGFAENVAPTIRGAAARYSTEGKTGGRSFLYGSLGVSLVSVPVRKISEYFTSSFIVQQFDAWRGGASVLPTPVQFLDSHKVDESNDGQVTRRCQDLESWQATAKDLSNARRQLEGADSYNTLRKRASTTLHLDQGDQRWVPMLDRYEAEADNLITTQILPNTVKAIDDFIFQALTSAARAGQSDVQEDTERVSSPAHPTHLRNWFSGLLGAIDKALEKVQSQETGGQARSTSTIRTAFESMRDAGRMARVSKWKSMRSDLVASLNSVTGLVTQRERHVVGRFYQALRKEIEQRDLILETLESALTEFNEFNRKKRDAFRHRNYILDESRLSQNEHPLELEVGTDAAYVEGQKDLLLENLSQSDLLNSIGRGGKDKESSAYWVGLATHYFEAAQQILVSQDERFRFDALEVRESVQNDIQSLVEQRVGASVHERLREQFNVYDALMSMISRFSDDARGYSGHRSQDADIRKRFEMHFGTEGARILLKDRENAQRKTWKEEAINRLVWRISTFSSPFWQLDPTDRHQSKGSLAQGVENRYMYVFVDHPGLRKILGQGLERLLEGRIKKDHIIPFRDPHALAVIQTDLGYPVYAIKGLEDDRLGYLEHIEKWRNAKVSQPYHVDRRFYDRWSDDLDRHTAATRGTTELSHLVYLMGLGSGVIQIERTQSGRKRFTMEGRTLGTSLPKLINLLEKAESDLHDLAEKIYHQTATVILAASLGKKGKDEQVWQIFLKGLEIHLGLKPPRTQEQSPPFELWQHIMSEGSIDHDSDGVWHIRGELVPKNPDDFKALNERLGESGQTG